MQSVYKTKTAEETINLGKQLAECLQPGSVVLLFGDLGSGKTHFTKGLAKGLGIEETIKSPTFTYVNTYKISSEEWLAKSGEQKKSLTAHSFRPKGSPSGLTALYHYDLYRLNPGDSFYSIGLQETLNDPEAINIIEWADRLSENLPKDYIRVDLKSGEDSHEISIQCYDSEVVPGEKVEQFWDTWSTPLHVRSHCKQVALVALQMGKAFINQNILVDLSLLQTACLLHDMARVCDFNEMDQTKFHEEISEEKWEKWLQLRKEFAGKNHADIAAEDLSKLGYFKTAELIRLHHSLSILSESNQFKNLETALVYYADKRVKHDEIVPLKERFKDGRERYGNEDDFTTKELYLEVEKKTFELEKNLFDRIDLEPAQIK